MRAILIWLGVAWITITLGGPWLFAGVVVAWIVLMMFLGIVQLVAHEPPPIEECDPTDNSFGQHAEKQDRINPHRDAARQESHEAP